MQRDFIASCFRNIALTLAFFSPLADTRMVHLPSTKTCSAMPCFALRKFTCLRLWKSTRQKSYSIKTTNGLLQLFKIIIEDLDKFDSNVKASKRSPSAPLMGHFLFLAFCSLQRERKWSLMENVYRIARE